jgi:GNAT superfamily N-acetyltransferase
LTSLAAVVPAVRLAPNLHRGIGPTVHGVGGGGLLEAVVRSDRRYFALGAEVHPLPGAEVLHLPGSRGVGAGTAVWVHDATAVVASRGWMQLAAELAAQLGAPALRIYGVGPDGPAAAACAAFGLTARSELAFCSPGAPRPSDRSGARLAGGGAAGRLQLRSADGAPGRAARRAVAGRAAVAPDGHVVDVERYLAGEEQRAAAGELDLSVAWDGGEPVAVFGELPSGPILRLKNLLVREDQREQGTARAIVSALVDRAHAAGLRLAAVGLAGEPGEALYRSVGMEVVGAYVEWSRPTQVDLASGPDACVVRRS